jgi:uncharacterized Zn-binding protein involved in type VI secretion
MPPAARVLDLTNHPGVVAGPGVATVLIEGKPAAVAGDFHTCGSPSTPHLTTSPLGPGSPTVLIGNRPALRTRDMAACGALISTGALRVVIG